MDLAPSDAFRTIEGARDDLLLLCDHASSRVPEDVTPLGLPAADMARHIAYDVGAAGVTERLAQALGAGAVLSCFSRLVIDPNRGEDDPTLVMRLSDGSIVPGNRGVDEAEVTRRLERFHRPYHRAVEGAIAARGRPALISVHSFTPALRGRPPRPWHVGVLWGGDPASGRALIERLRAATDWVVGDNQPYTGALQGDCMDRHGTATGLRHVLIEVRNDLIATAEDQRTWADALAPHLEAVLAQRKIAAPVGSGEVGEDTSGR